MAKGGIFQALGNLWRWTIWGLAGVLVVALWLGWSNREAGPDDVTLAESETAPEPAAEPAAEAEAVAEEAAADVTEAATETATEATEAASEATETVADAVEELASEAEAAASDAAQEVETVLEGAATAVGEAAATAESGLADLANKAEAALGEAREAVEGAPAAEQQLAAQDAVDSADADLNIVSPAFSDIRLPGDDATYALISAFQRDDGTIEVVSERSLDGQTTQTIRLVTCAPLAVGVVSEGDGPRNDTPELERIPLGTAAATLAALACGAMN